MDQKKVSIIIPVYNAEKYIKKCLDSLLIQTYNNIEIITVLDGCTDNTEKIVRELNDIDDRIKIISRENKGVQYSRKEGLEKSNGDYIFFLDADDWIDECTIYEMMKKAKENDIDIVKCSYMNEYKNSTIANYYNYSFKEIDIVNHEQFSEVIYPDIINTYIYNSMWGQLIKKSIIDIEAFKENLNYGEDFDFNLKIYTKANNVLRTNEVYYHYRDTVDGITKNPDYNKIMIRLKSCIKAYSELFNMLKIWNIDNTKYTYLVSVRIIKEVTNVVLSLIMTGEPYKKIKKDLINLMLCDNIKNNIEIIKKGNNIYKNKNKLCFKLICMKKISILIIYVRYIYKPIYICKKIIKKILKK